MSNTHFRLALAVTTSEMHEIASALSTSHPQIAGAIRKQWLEITNSGVNVFSPYYHDASEPMVGLTETAIVFMRGIAD